MRVTRYHPAEKALWDEFVRRSRNGTFLFNRDYLEYHGDRFPDHSLVIRDAKDRILTLLPAHQDGKTACSHHGLTYGGFIVGDGLKTLRMVEVFLKALKYFREQGFSALTYRTIPTIYHRAPSQADLFALQFCEAELERRVVMSAASSRHHLPVQELRKRGAKKAMHDGIEVRECAEYDRYWELLEEVLGSIHGAKPVHTVAEIKGLRERFPKNIRLYCAYRSEVMVAGVLIFETRLVARAQYIAANTAGKESGALDLLFRVLLEEEFGTKDYFEFGSSGIPGTNRLNCGLIEQKEGFGARTVVSDHYRIDLTRWKPDALQGLLDA